MWSKARISGPSSTPSSPQVSKSAHYRWSGSTTPPPRSSIRPIASCQNIKKRSTTSPQDQQSPWKSDRTTSSINYAHLPDPTTQTSQGNLNPTPYAPNSETIGSSTPYIAPIWQRMGNLKCSTSSERCWGQHDHRALYLITNGCIGNEKYGV
jgi:hypothetical protein